MHAVAAIFGFFLLALILWDAFENVILPRYVVRRFRSARMLSYLFWLIWAACARAIASPKRRESFLSYFGPLSLLLILTVWAAGLIAAFALILWGNGSAVLVSGEMPTFRTDLYLSGSTFFTPGIGDVTPIATLARIVTVCEAGTGFGFLAIVIAYLPTLYSAFEQREVHISMLDARAGSPPTAGELLRRHGRARIDDGLGDYLHDWEAWSAQLMETHLSYPILCFFRSQHHNQSWLAAFASILDVCALLIAYGEGEAKWRAQLTFAIARHAISDLCEILRVRPVPCRPERLATEDLPQARALLLECGVGKCTESGDAKLRELQAMYEPYLNGLSQLLCMPLPSWGVGVEFAKQPRSAVWARITSPAPPGPTPPVHDDDTNHL
jgi:Ion channel